MAQTIVPTTGVVITAAASAEVWSYLGPPHVISGFAITGSAGLVLTLASGELLIAGKHITESASTDVTLDANDTHYIYYDSVLLNIDFSPLGAGSGNILLAKATTDGSTVTSSSDQRLLHGDTQVIHRMIAAGSFTITSVTRNSEDLITAFSGLWSDGTDMTNTVTRNSDGFVTIEVYTHQSYGQVTVTYTRNSSNFVTVIAYS